MTTTEKLNITPEEYENMTLSLWMRWSESVSVNARQYQTVLASSSINKWFLTELVKCESEFHLSTDRYMDSPTVSIADLKNCYVKCTYRMFNIRPMALLELTKPKGSMSLNSNGIPIFNALNQN